ncbi:unnamed protein product [Eruca vesicaria subsp. sativa]|uniref:Dof zinc finger protein n=1 Tax=Eruca vesicaria subsp. sativa TaxID=29727 RepID=A0ABC8L3V8_ERUVS|nr:unnamed protein product [Eruca vesicaria subsp. sativa]
MQGIHDYSMTGARGGGGGSSGRFFGGDRRMRGHHHILNNHHQISLKCPRCNSLNTKFCYYNNYNHSQPRHFCKNCRRYWTKGGVLRNVPVGGGCRKAKRSKSKQLPSSSQDGEEKPSSRESSSLTAFTSTATTTATTATEWSTLLGQSSLDGGVFSEMGGFTAVSIETTPFGLGGSSLNQECIADHQQFEDRMVQVDPTMGYEPLDWGSGGCDQTLFELTSTVDHEYWSHQDRNDIYHPQF